MKRVDTGDREGKRLKIGKSIEGLEIEIMNLRKQEKYAETIPLCHELLSRNDMHAKGHYWMSAALAKVHGSEERSIHHLLKCVDSTNDPETQSKAFYNLGIESENRGKRDKARENYKNSLKCAQGHWTNNAYLYLSTINLRESEAFGRNAFDNSMKQFGSLRYEEIFGKKDYQEFNRSLKIYEPDKWAEIQPIMNDSRAAFTLVENYHEMFTKWSKLMAIHQHKLKNDVPAIYENLLAIAEKERFILITVNRIFTDQTVLIIHDFLYHV